jgi:hypothetical protein
MSKYLILAAAAAAGGLASGPASAGVQVLIRLYGAGQATPIDSGVSAAVTTGLTFPKTAPGAFGTFAINRDTVIDPSGAGTNLGSVALNAVASAAVAKAGTTITILAAENGMPKPTAAIKFTANFTENFLPDGWTVTEAAYYNLAGNLVFDPAKPTSNDIVMIGDAVPPFDEAGEATSSVTVAAADFRGNYSLYEVYTVTLAANAVIGQDLSTINIMSGPADPPGNSPMVAAVSGAPELSTWVMMGLGFAGLSLAGWKERKSRASAAARLG